ncbi:MAG TPA: GFA family protein [Solimonas sp.]
MNASAAVHRGSCLCGLVAFEIEGEFERFYLCHCSHCRKDTGSAHAANLFSSSAQLRWLQGQENVQRFDLPQTRHSRSFCTTCGSAMPSLQMEGALLVVPAGSLDTAVPNRPNAHIFAASRANWDRDLESAPSADRFPEPG